MVVKLVANKHATMEARRRMGSKEMVNLHKDKDSVRGVTLSDNSYSAGGDPMPLVHCREG